MPFTAFPPTFDAVAAFGIGGLAVLVASAAVALVRRAAPEAGGRAQIVVAAWMLTMGGLALAGVLARFDRTPPPMAFVIPCLLAAGTAIGVSSIGARLAAGIPLATLVGFHAFRLPLELVMHHASAVGIMPPELSYSGYNFDIVTGASALVLSTAMRSTPVPRAVVWIWNLFGIGCLMAITVIAVASSPMVRAFGDDPRHVNTWVMYFPYIWLPSVLVVLAVAGHIVVTRALLARHQ